jgi:hypothetical protein
MPFSSVSGETPRLARNPSPASCSGDVVSGEGLIGQGVEGQLFHRVVLEVVGDERELVVDSHGSMVASVAARVMPFLA